MPEKAKAPVSGKGLVEQIKHIVCLESATTSRQEHTRYIVQDCDADPAKSFMLFVDSWGVCYLTPCFGEAR